MPSPHSPRTRPRTRAVLTLVSAAATSLALVGAASTAPNGGSAPPRYGRDIRPLLSDRCFRCHGPDGGERQADLRLDVFAEAVRERDGVRAIVPGAPDESELWLRITHDDPIERMPPASSHKAALDADEVELVRRWIEAGAKYEEHWAFVPPERPAVPAGANSAGAERTDTAHEVDAFLAAALDVRGIEPNPEAEKATLLRRVYLGLTGLPPTPEELDAFLADDSLDAYARVVERLLYEEPYASRFAEHFASGWLDAARYADTIGIHTDNGRQMWAWRDWVLRALRDGMPFDRFLTEQMAGDLLPDATLDQRIATGFHRAHVITDEGGAISEEYLVEYAVDRVATTSTVFLGLTMGCARCHDHKFDPIDQEDFYSLYAFFNSIDEPGLYTQEADPERAFEPALEIPSEDEAREIARLETELEAARTALDAPIPGEAEERTAFLADMLAATELRWVAATATDASSAGGATLTIEQDGSVFASGANPDTDSHVVAIATEATDLRLVALEALADERLPAGRVGRAPNGNAVLGAIHAEAISIANPAQRQPVRFTWAWADTEQLNGDYRVVNALKRDDDRLGWAVDAHNQGGNRVALFLADAPFGFEGGTRLEVSLDYDSPYAQHAFGRVRLSLASLAEAGLDALAVATSGWYATAPFNAKSADEVYATAFGPETVPDIDTERFFDGLSFNYIDVFRDDRLNIELAGGINATYAAKRFFVPSAREIEISLGTDDGFLLFVDGEEVARREVNRGVAKDQDRVTLPLPAGEHAVVLKIVNTGGQAGYYWNELRRDLELAGPLVAALLPEAAQTDVLAQALREAWLHELSPTYRGRAESVGALDSELAALRADVPRTMVMRELEEPRATYVLERGLYDHANENRPVERAVPKVLGHLPARAPHNRLGLAQWMTSAENPLVARVAVNRIWAFVFGAGLVATGDDFGLQGEWPSHPALLDWLAVEYRESGWDTKALLQRLVSSAAFRRDTRARPDLAELDPDNRLLARFPRRRLSAEAIRDQALFVSGLLVESFGGAPVKPLQPAGLWQEVAMLASNTREFEASAGDDRWRRSVYTYWKRACPPPAMLAFDAPTREFCVVAREETASPLQALVLWNDSTFVAAARRLAELTLAEPGNDEQRLARLLRRCTGRAPDPADGAALQDALQDFRERYEADPAAAAALAFPAPDPTPTDESMTPTESRPDPTGPAPDGVRPYFGDELPPAELAVERAAWTLLATAILSLDATITQG